MKTCPQCGRAVPDSATVCSSCNASLAAVSAGQQPVKAATSGKAVTSLILSFFSLLFIPGVLAVILGHISWSQIKKSGGRLKGKGLALAGLILGYGGIASIIPFWLIVAAIAIPNLLRSRYAAGQASAVGSLRTLNTAAITYSSTYRGFPENLAVMRASTDNKTPDANAAGLIDEVLASGRKSGYVFTYAVAERDEKGFPSAYTINADPVEAGNTGQNHYFTDQSGVIRSERERPANKGSPPLAG